MSKKDNKAAGAAYTKEQLLQSKKYSAAQKDVLRAVLKDGQAYTHKQAAQELHTFLNEEAR
ncbi:hypothetical protein D3C80_1651260 [compost metagenome]